MRSAKNAGAAAHGPLDGVRVVEASRGRPARIAGMLLADLGADVVRLVTPDAPPEPLTPETVCWDRGKSVVRAPLRDLHEDGGAADVVLVDEAPSSLESQGLSRAAVRRVHPGAVHVWLPAYGEHGEWKDLPEDPLLLAGLGCLAVYYPADDDSPVAPVVAGLTHLHGALGASAAVGGLVGRVRTGTAHAGVVTGLGAAAMLMGTSFAEIDGGPSFMPSRALRGAPNWRTYRCADGEWLFLAALTPDIFFRALEALDRLDVMALPEVAGDFQAIADLARGRLAAGAELEAVFAALPSTHWLARLQAARVPCTTVRSRAEWMDSEIVRANDGRVDLLHPELGTVTMPNVPLTFSATPGRVRRFARAFDPADRADTLPRAPGSAVPASSGPPTSQPLDGVTVVDGASFLAGPMVSAILADFGADVVKVEPPGGEPYRTFPLAFLAVNQLKRGVELDLRRPEGVAGLHRLLAGADVFVENLRPGMLGSLGLGGNGSPPAFPQLVHCSVSAFGHAEAFADLPGFDPVFQSLNGMAIAQGPDDEPVVTGAPLNDTATGALGALGSLAALFQRYSGGAGQRVRISLASASTFIQSGEMTSWPGSPPPQRGDVMFRGPDAGHRYYACADGWIGVAAVTEELRVRLCTGLGITDVTEAEVVLAALTVASATSALARHGVPACRVVPRNLPMRDPFLVDNGFGHVVPFPPDSTARVVGPMSRWPGTEPVRGPRHFSPGEDSSSVLAADSAGSGVG